MTYRILVMAKAPVPGTIKTRLGLHPRVAAGLQAALIQDTAGKARFLAPTTVAVAPPEKLDLVRALLPEDVALIPQSPGDLGDWMLAAAGTLFDASPVPVLLLGTDAPTLPAEAIEGAASALDTHDLSIIPSRDGGYVLLGLRRPVGRSSAGWTGRRRPCSGRRSGGQRGRALRVRGGAVVGRGRTGGPRAARGGARRPSRAGPADRGFLEGAVRGAGGC